MISGVMYWPFCDFVTFKFIPVHLQVCDITYMSVNYNNPIVFNNKINSHVNNFLSSFQPLVSNSFAYLWTVYLTYMASLEKADV